MRTWSIQSGRTNVSVSAVTAHHVLDRRAEVPEDPLRSSTRASPPIGTTAERLHEDHLRLGSDLVDHRHGDDPDAVVEDDHIGRLASITLESSEVPLASPTTS